MIVKVSLFATLRQKAGLSQLELELPAGTTVRQLLNLLDERYPAMRVLKVPVYVAVDGEYASADTVLRHGHEIALFPPVSGG